MLSRAILLSTMLLLMACNSTQAEPTVQASQLIIPTPPPTAVANTPLLPILLPNEANKWIAFYDGLSDFGLALPQQWRITPPNPYAAQPTLTVANFDTTLTDNSCSWPDGLAQLAFTAWEVTPEQPTLDWISKQQVEVESLEAAVNGRYAGYLLTTSQQQALILRLTPDLIIQIQVTSHTAWQLADVQSLLHSLAAPGEAVDIPAVHPGAPVAVPGFCREATILYAGPGDHFAQVGLLFATDSLPVIGRSHDGRWLKLLYPAAPSHIAWASLQDTIATAGEPPIQPIQVQPGNS